MMSDRQEGALRSIRTNLLAGLALVSFTVVGVGGWAYATTLAGAVIANGQIVVDSEVKKVQHPTGGVVGEILVRNGDRVRAGDVVVKLDETQTKAGLAVVLKAMDEITARRARNEAEQDGADTISFPVELVARGARDPAVSLLLRGETRLFELRREAREGQKAQRRQRIRQLQDEIRGLVQQQQAKGREIVLIQNELVGVRELWSKNLIAIGRVTSLERDAVRLEGERGQLVAATAQAEGRVTETELQILQIDQDLRTEVGRDLAEARGKLSELAEKRISAEDQLKRIDLRAPQDGTVHQMAVHTVGGLVTSSEPVMLIVPEGDTLAIELRLQPRDIDMVYHGQSARLRFTAFNQGTTPELQGHLTRIAADVTTDPKTGASFYTARVAVRDGELARLGNLQIVPGMPVDAFIKTGDRTVLTYLTKPLVDQVAKVWRER